MPTLFDKISANAESRLTLPTNRPPSEELARYKTFLKVETHRLKILHRGGGSGHQVCQARATILDLLLRYILNAVKNTLSPSDIKATQSLALVAIGGYGRAELNPHSDIDIMFLHDGSLVSRNKPHAALTALTDGLLYTLWDLGMKVGHSVRSIEDCVSVANTDMQSKTSLIESRLITGEVALFDKFQKAVTSRCVEGYETEYIDARLADQAARRTKYGNFVMMQEPNIKNGCGGLRDYQNLIWMSYFKYRTRSLLELEQKGMVSSSERKQLESAYDFLLRTRNELHYLIDRSGDVMQKANQPSVALHLGYSNRSPSGRLETFMRDYYNHSRNIDLITRTVEQRLALVPQKKLLASLGQMLKSRREKARVQLLDGFRILDGQILPNTNQIFKESPKRMMRVFLYAQQRGLAMHPDLTQLLRNNLQLVDRSFLKDEHVRETFLEILDQRGNVAPVLRQMHEVGFLGKFVPEFGKLTCLVQHEFYHQYAADEHTLVCIQKLDQLWETEAPNLKPYGDVFRHVERPFVLYLALLLHDSGKALHTGKHEEVGSQLALKVAKRLGLDGATTHSLSLLIQEHLTMAQISQRRDLDDAAVIKTFAAQIQTVENLKMLHLHTFADSTGTSDQLWNGFKDTLLWTLFHKTRNALSGGTEFILAETRQREILMEEVRRVLPKNYSEEEIDAHFSNLPPRYFQIHDAKEILHDLMLVHEFIQKQVSDRENPLEPVVSWQNEPDRGYTLVTVCTFDRTGLFSSICGSLTAAGLNILAADIVTRADGIILDSFFVVDARTGVLANRDERNSCEQILDKILTGEEVDLDNLIRKQKLPSATYKPLEGEVIPSRIHFDNDTSDTRTVIDIETEDSVGLLYRVTMILADLNVDISLAKISTEKGAAIDTFYVTEEDGAKIEDAHRQKELSNALKQALQ